MSDWENAYVPHVSDPLASRKSRPPRFELPKELAPSDAAFGPILTVMPVSWWQLK